ncbi:MAG: hypothetical protein ACI9O6_000550 [Glaciecola sp.]|jgi:hypothetical protein
MAHKKVVLFFDFKKFGLALLLAMMAFFGNIFPIPLAFGVDLIFDPIFVLVAISYLGVGAY